MGINLISFTAQNKALHMLGKKGHFWHLGGHGPFPPKSAYAATHSIFCVVRTVRFRPLPTFQKIEFVL